MSDILRKLGLFDMAHGYGHLRDLYINRYYHSIEHVEKMLLGLSKYKPLLSVSEIEDLEIAIGFHDAIYDPRRNDNEERSAEEARKFLKAHPESIIGQLFPKDRIDSIVKLILATKNHKVSAGLSSLEEIIIRLDLQVIDSDFNELIAWEHGIFKEYQFAPIETYIQKRSDFLRQYCENNDNIKSLMTYVNTRKYKIGIYPGSFNPFHVGHKDILEQAEKMFDKVIIARGINPEKNNEILPLPDMENEVVIYSGLVTDLFKYGRYNTELFLVRGLRNSFDVAEEETFRRVVHDINSSIKFSYFFSDKTHISSSMIRGLMKFDKEKAERYIVK